MHYSQVTFYSIDSCHSTVPVVIIYIIITHLENFKGYIMYSIYSLSALYVTVFYMKFQIVLFQYKDEILLQNLTHLFAI